MSSKKRNSTYEIIGPEWDGLPAFQKECQFIPFDNSIPEINNQQMTINDEILVQRYVSIQHAFSLIGTESINMYLSGTRCIQVIAILDDLHPNHSALLLCSFYERRVLQLVQKIHDLNPQAEIKFMHSENSHSTVFSPHDHHTGTITWLIKTIDRIVEYLRANNISFSEDGLPILGLHQYTTNFPKVVTTYKYRNATYVPGPSDTAICFYTRDSDIFSTINKIPNNMGEFKKYSAIVGFDVTVTRDMDIELQQTIMLFNQLCTAAIATTGIKVIPNLRTALPQTLSCLDNIPPKTISAIGLLGCSKNKACDDFDCIAKIMKVRPAGLIIYGKRDPILEEQLFRMGICFRRYEDVRTLNFKQKSHSAPDMGRSAS